MADNFVRKVNKTGKVTDEPFYTNDPLDLLGEKDNNQAYIRLEQEYHCLTDNVKSINGTIKPDKNGNVNRIVTTINGITPTDSGQLTIPLPYVIYTIDEGDTLRALIGSSGLTVTVGKLATDLPSLNDYPITSAQVKPTVVSDMNNYYEYRVPKTDTKQYLGVYIASNLASLRKMIKIVEIPPKA